MNNSWIACEVMADMKKVYEDLIIINLYQATISIFPYLLGTYLLLILEIKSGVKYISNKKAENYHYSSSVSCLL